MTTTRDDLLRRILLEPDDDAPRLVLADFLEENGGAADLARAEFVRVQCRLPGLEAEYQHLIHATATHARNRGAGGQMATCYCARCARLEDVAGEISDLRRRERELLDEYWAAWVHAVYDPLAYDVGVSTSGSGTRFKVALYDRGGGERGHGECAFRRGFVEVVTLDSAAWLAHADALLAAAPLREVRLTTVPQWDYVDSDMCIAYLDRGPERHMDLDATELPEGADIVEALLHQHWPGPDGRLRFVLPT